MGILREARQAKNKAKRLGKNAGSDGAVIFIGLGLVTVAGLVWYGVAHGKTASASTITPDSNAPVPLDPTQTTWLASSGGVPAGSQFALVVPTTTISPAEVSAMVQSFQTLLPGATITLPGQAPPAGWPIADDGGGSTAVRVLGINSTGTVLPVNAPAAVWTKSL